MRGRHRLSGTPGPTQSTGRAICNEPPIETNTTVRHRGVSCLHVSRNRYKIGLDRSHNTCYAKTLKNRFPITGPEPEEMAGIIAEAGDAGVLTIVDHTLRMYSQGPSLAAAACEMPGCILVTSLSECHGLAGLPLSYAIGERKVIDGLRRGMPSYSPGSLAAAAATLRDRAYPLRTRTVMREEAAFIEAGLGKVPGISYFATGCGSFVVTLTRETAKPLETFLRYNILVDNLGEADTLFFPVKQHKWNARFIKTLKNIMGAKIS